MKRGNEKLSTQMKRRARTELKTKPSLDGDIITMISTGSTLLDLAISGGRVRGGGLPGGILVEISGAESTGKTVLLCEIAGAVQRQGGQVMFLDPEARLNKQFAQMFDLDVDVMEYSNPDTVKKAFLPIAEWKPEPDDKIHIICTDSLAALVTEMEMEDKDGMGTRRARDFSKETRNACRIITAKNYLMVCSNQLRDNVGGGPYTPKSITPGGRAIPYYSSVRLRCRLAKKIKIEKTIAGKKITRINGINITVEVFKNTVWKPFRVAPVTILFDYGIDDIGQNLQYIKTNTGSSVYTLRGKKLSKSLDQAVAQIEGNGWEKRLKREVMNLWEEIESKFAQERKVKKR